VVLGRRPNSTSWEAIGQEGAEGVDRVTVFLFSAPLYFANAALLHNEVHAALRQYADTKFLVMDAAAMTDVDFTGLMALNALVADLGRDNVEVVFARANDAVRRALVNAPSSDLARLRVFGTVDEAVLAVSS
jgi:MFS superfamily sulfate permease-like transporter